ncbi:protease inhibitor Inh/omp19 family protein [Alsobacter sp. SYSU M60028]|uniref:Protease inhibitor Inh/omp19 family protein n=1 Tax=Alsobacter ponti TaxID=2962936 RepID=A0ABT1LDL5_9HYPH|nr:AprI/Inh family metalloprotease inhibitor [Alsobacter ponti]MCP8939584.1 protease inhibitor Inh/omp19 family protein [Alsobacter ponti]
MTVACARGTWRWAVSALGALVVAGLALPAFAQEAARGQPVAGDLPANVMDALAGPWDLTNPRTRKTCRVQFGAGRATHGYVLGVPPACRATAPALAQISGWAVTQDRRIAFLDASGQVATEFRAEKEGRYASPDPDRMVLAPVGGQAGDRANAVSTALAKAVMTDLPALTPDVVFGLYGVARDKYKPICSIELTSRPAPRRGQYVAILSGGCLDSGLKLFDPTSWYTERGRLHLVARKGHEQSFAQGPDRIFEKNPPSGAQIYLKKQ